jgi:hypothetical protein
MLTVYEYADAVVDEDGYVIDDEGFVVGGGRHNEEHCGNPKKIIIVDNLPSNAYRYDGRPEFVAVSATPGAIAGVLTLMTVQYNNQTKNIKIGQYFDWGENTYEIVDVNAVGLEINQQYGTLKLQAKRAAGGLHGYE